MATMSPMDPEILERIKQTLLRSLATSTDPKPMRKAERITDAEKVAAPIHVRVVTDGSVEGTQLIDLETDRPMEGIVVEQIAHAPPGYPESIEKMRSKYLRDTCRDAVKDWRTPEQKDDGEVQIYFDPAEGFKVGVPKEKKAQEITPDDVWDAVKRACR